MLHLRVFTNAPRVDDIVQLLDATDGVHHLTRADGAVVGLDAVVTADVSAGAADSVLQALADAGVPPDDVSLVRLDAIGSAPTTTWKWLQSPDEGVAWTEILGVARTSARPGARYLAAMLAAGVIASVGVGTANQILIVGAMAVSPDLLPLSAFCVGLVGQRWHLALRAFLTLAAGLVAAGLAALATGGVLDWSGILDHPLGTGGLGTLTTPDITTVIVAFAAGVAGMLAFETRAAAAVGVAISVTTIPAVAYFAVALVEGRTNDAWGALAVLGTNVLTLLAAGTLTLWVQRQIRMRTG